MSPSDGWGPGTREMAMQPADPAALERGKAKALANLALTFVLGAYALGFAVAIVGGIALQRSPGAWFLSFFFAALLTFAANVGGIVLAIRWLVQYVKQRENPGRVRAIATLLLGVLGLVGSFALLVLAAATGAT